MEKTELYEMIESYLEGSLPEAKQQEVEQRMATDDAFREEVELHRALQEDYEDPARWRLREALAEAMQAPLPTDEPPTTTLPGSKTERSSKWWFALPLLLLLCGGIWYFWKSTPPPAAPASPAIETPATPLPEEQQDTPPANEEEDSQLPVPKTPSQKNNKPVPIAQANPANFTENPAMEALMNLRGDNEITLKMSTPENAAAFQPDEKGKTQLRFAGTLERLPPNEAALFDLLIFDNKNSNKHLLKLHLQAAADAKGQATFDLRQAVSYPQGLYYFRIEERELREVLIVGKFLIKS